MRTIITGLLVCIAAGCVSFSRAGIVFGGGGGGGSASPGTLNSSYSITYIDATSPTTTVTYAQGQDIVRVNMAANTTLVVDFSSVDATEYIAIQQLWLYYPTTNHVLTLSSSGIRPVGGEAPDLTVTEAKTTQFFSFMKTGNDEPIVYSLWDTWVNEE